MYKKRVPYFKAKPLQKTAFNTIPIDCSCEIWMILFHMQFNPRLLDVFDFYFAMSTSTIAAEKFIIKYIMKILIRIKNNLSHLCKKEPLLVFDGIQTNPYKKALTEERRTQRNEAYQDFIISLHFSKKNIGKSYLKYVSHECAGYQQLIYEHCLKHSLHPIRAKNDSDFLLSQHPVVYSHDLDLILMGCSQIITAVGDDGVYHKSLNDIIKEWKLSNRDELIVICLLLGTDYNLHQEVTKSFSQYRKMNLSPLSLSDPYLKELYELLSHKKETL